MVDYVFPWVNHLDRFWRESYLKAAKAEGQKICVDGERFRDFRTMKYQLRGIDRFMPWVDRAIILVSSKSQIPQWANIKTLTFITHDQFIPKKFLPTFNSNTIEMFLANLDLSERVIYSNDDFYVMAPTVESDFFSEEGYPKIYMKAKQKVKNPFQKCVKRTSDLVINDFASMLDPDLYWRPPHAQTPLLFSCIKEVYAKHKDEIEKSVTKFRDLDKNLNQYMYADYQICSGKWKQVPKISRYLEMSAANLETIEEQMRRPDLPLLCLNDTPKTNEKVVLLVQRLFKEIFPDKSRFEL